MKALKIAATILLAALLLITGLAAETLALSRVTVLDANFYGKNERAAYELVGSVIVRKLADAVLDYAPPAALRTTNREQAQELAMRAFPPIRIADMLEDSGPYIAQYLIHGGDIPVLGGSREFAQGEEAVVRALLMDGIWDMLPQKPQLPVFMPFTPEWNLVYAAPLSQGLRLPRWYVSLADHALGLALSALVMVAGLLYLLWIRERKPFFAASGIALTVNGLLFGVLAAAAAYWSRPIAAAGTAIFPLNAAADLFGQDFPALVFAVLVPFRKIFLLSAAVMLSFGITTFTIGIRQRKSLETLGIRISSPSISRHPKHARIKA